MTPWALEKYKSTKAPHTGGYTGESDDTTLKCYPPGVPRIYLFNFPMEILVVPDRVLIVHEFGHFIRQIWTDGRPASAEYKSQLDGRLHRKMGRRHAGRRHDWFQR